MAIHSRILAWRIPWTDGPWRPQSMWSQESDMTQRLNHHLSVCVLIPDFQFVPKSLEKNLALFGLEILCFCGILSMKQFSQSHPSQRAEWFCLINHSCENVSKRFSAGSHCCCRIDMPTKPEGDGQAKRCLLARVGTAHLSLRAA